MKKPRIAAILIIMCMFFNFICLADDTSLGRTPEGVYPMNNSDIEMVDELINVYLEEGRVECTFTFKNTGEENTVLMGFPATLDKNYVENSPGPKEGAVIKNFTAFDGEKELQVKLENEVKVDLKSDEEVNHRKRFYDKWYTFETSFKAEETKIIKNTYEYTASICAVGPGLIRTGYVLDTGAAWKKNIGHAKVIFHLKDIPFTRIHSFFPFDMEALTLEKDKLIFEESDFEPDFNLELEYWHDPGKLDEDDSFNQYLNNVSNSRKQEYFDIIRTNNKECGFIDAVAKGNKIGILYFSKKIDKEKHQASSPQIGEISIDHDKNLDLSIVDFSGDLKSVKYEIYSYSLENKNTILYEEERKIEENNVEGFGVNQRIGRNEYSKSYNEKNSFKLKVSAIDYKDNILNYETDIYLNGKPEETEKISETVVNKNKETKLKNSEAEKEENVLVQAEKNVDKADKDDGSMKIALCVLIAVLILVCIIQQIKLDKLTK